MVRKCLHIASVVAVLLGPAVVRAQAGDSADGPEESRAYLDQLVAALETDDSFKVRLQAAVFLGRSGSERAVEPLITALADQHYTVRAAAATALANLHETRAISHIVKRIAIDPDPFVREEATRALDKYDRDQALTYVIASYDGFEAPEDGRIRKVAMSYLVEGDPSKDSLPVLERGLGDTAEIFQMVSTYLQNLEPEEGLTVLRRAIRHKEPAVRRGAVRVLRALATKPATDLILKVYQRDIEVEEVREETRVALRERREFIDIDSVIRDARESTEKHARARALKLLGVVGGEKAEGVLLKALDDDDIYVRGNAVLAMQWLGREAVVPKLEALANNPDNQRIMHLVNNTLKKLRQTATQ